MNSPASGEPIISLLTPPDLSATGAEDGSLPYRLDLLERSGFELAWVDRTPPRRFASLVAAIEARTTPMLQACRSRHLRRTATATIAMFESEGHGLAAWRTLTRRRPQPLIIIGCWLADLAVGGGRARRLLYRLLYRSVDRVVVFSGNQIDTLEQRLGIRSDRVVVVRFGIDLEELANIVPSENGRVIAVGRDLGRDWPTLLTAADGCGWDLNLVTRPSQVAGLRIPEGTSVHGQVGRREYLRMLSSSSVVVVPTDVREYPTGQTVLLEAMALGKACVVTETPAMLEYVIPGETALTVPAADPVALRDAVSRLLSDEHLRHRIGTSARAHEMATGGAERMWTQIADAITRCTTQPGR